MFMSKQTRVYWDDPMWMTNFMIIAYRSASEQILLLYGIERSHFSQAKLRFFLIQILFKRFTDAFITFTQCCY